MIGVLASLKTMRGIQNKWPNRYPAMDKIAGIFPDHPLALNLIHYNTKEKDTLGDQLVAMTEFGGTNMHGFQLNIAWPSLDVLREYRKEHATKQIVLQVGEHAFEMVNHSPEQLALRVAEYDGMVEYVLLDPSGGYGKPFDPALARDYLLALKAQNLGMGFGVAGGLSPTTLDLVRPLAKEFPDLSIDAEGRLRTPEDHLDLGVASDYLRVALSVFNGASKL
ncbi:MAG: hypothetical protein HYS60_02110 [Candidatus Wildermuthbacteria bacterium]|nr:hypothetical protein [Candidatus Wildermuthbacteria bacterium]